MLVMIFFIWLISGSQKADVEEIDSRVISLSDYTVEIHNLHCVHDKKYDNIDEKDGKRHVHDDLLRADIKNHFETYLSERPHVGEKNDESLKKNEKIKVHEIIFGKGDGDVIKLKRNRGKVIKEIAHLDGQIKLKGKGKRREQKYRKIERKVGKQKICEEED